MKRVIAACIPLTVYRCPLKVRISLESCIITTNGAICSFVKVLLAKRDVMHLIAPRDANYRTQAVYR